MQADEKKHLTKNFLPPGEIPRLAFINSTDYSQQRSANLPVSYVCLHR